MQEEKRNEGDRGRGRRQEESKKITLSPERGKKRGEGGGGLRHKA